MLCSQGLASHLGNTIAKEKRLLALEARTGLRVQIVYAHDRKQARKVYAFLDGIGERPWMRWKKR
jgi:hypothetical protein